MPCRVRIARRHAAASRNFSRATELVPEHKPAVRGLRDLESRAQKLVDEASRLRASQPAQVRAALKEARGLIPAGHPLVDKIDESLRQLR